MRLAQSVPDRHVDDAHGHGTLAVTVRLLVAHTHAPGLVWIDEAIITLDFPGSGAHEAGNEALAQEALRRVSAVRIEAEPDDRSSIHNAVDDDREDARGHGREVDVGVRNLGSDRATMSRMARMRMRHSLK
jgi:hypothetical protein